MRFVVAAALAMFTLTGCDMIDTTSASGPVDVATLAPLSGREQALIFGADGAAAQGNYTAAERDYLSAIGESKGHIDAHIALARLYAKQKQPEKEEVILKKALQFQPKQPLVNYMLGKLYLESGQNAEALAAFQQGRTSMPDDMDLSVGQAVAHDMLGQHTAAQRIYQRVISLNQSADLTNVRTNLAMSYMLNNDPKRAVELLKADAKKPNASPVTRHNLALAYGMLGKNSEAKALLHGEIDEETRQLAIGRMREYTQDRKNDAKTPPLTPTITDVDAQTATPGDVKQPGVGVKKR